MKNIVLVILSGLTCSNWVCGKCQDSYKLKEINEISKVVNCEEITGDLEVTGSFSGLLKLDKLKKVHGSIKVNAKNVGQISFDNLETVVNNMEIKDQTSVSVIYFPKLNSVNKLSLNTVGGDYALTFEPGLKNINQLEILDTRLSKLQGIRAERISNILINGAPELTQFELNETKDIVDSFEVIGANKCKVNAPKLVVVGKNLKLVDISSVSLNSLSSVGGEATFTRVGSSDLSFPNLDKVGAPGLTISDNQQIQHAKFPNLTKINGFLNVNKTPELKSLDLSRLDMVKDSFLVESPKLSEFKFSESIHGGGGFRIKSLMECSKLDKTQGHFSNFNCDQVKKDHDDNNNGNDNNNKPQKPNNPDSNPSGVNGLQINLTLSLLMSCLVILFFN